MLHTPIRCYARYYAILLIILRAYADAAPPYATLYYAADADATLIFSPLLPFLLTFDVLRYALITPRRFFRCCLLFLLRAKMLLSLLPRETCWRFHFATRCHYATARHTLYFTRAGCRGDAAYCFRRRQIDIFFRDMPAPPLMIRAFLQRLIIAA